MYQSDVLREALLHIPLGKKDIGKPQRIRIKGKLSEVMNSLAHNPNLDPNTLNFLDIDKMEISLEEKKKLKQLKVLWDILNKKEPVNPKQFGKDLEAIIEELRREAEDLKADDEAFETDDEYKHKMRDAEKLTNALLCVDLNANDVNPSSRRQIEKSIKDIMNDLAHDKSFNPDKATEKEIKKMDLSPDEIEELLKLKHI